MIKTKILKFLSLGLTRNDTVIIPGTDYEIEGLRVFKSAKINSHGLQDQTLTLCQQRLAENTEEGEHMWKGQRSIPLLKELLH